MIDFEKTFKKSKEIRKAIMEIIGKRKPFQGSMKCPECGQTRTFGIASNGHVWSRCEGEDCINWME